jgi:hypothetical protein
LRRIPIAALAIILLLSPAAFSQKRTRRSTTSSRTRAAAAARAAAATAAEVQQGATRVADQIKILTKFIYLLGGVARGIEAVDQAAKRNEASPTVIAQTKKNKETVRTSLQNVRAGLDKLELDFRSSMNLNRYYLNLAGVANGAATAEGQAAGGEYDKAGRTLLEVVNRLTDTLLAMR